jgi:hypothetical protein
VDDDGRREPHLREGVTERLASTARRAEVVVLAIISDVDDVEVVGQLGCCWCGAVEMALVRRRGAWCDGVVVLSS